MGEKIGFDVGDQLQQLPGGQVQNGIPVLEQKLLDKSRASRDGSTTVEGEYWGPTLQFGGDPSGGGAG